MARVEKIWTHVGRLSASAADFADPPGFQGNGKIMLYEDEDYVEATERAVRKATFLPASIDGRAVPVQFSFHVVFGETEGCVVTAYPNLGYQAAEQGPGHVAPQEILTDFDPADG